MLAAAIEEMKSKDALREGIAAFVRASHYSQSHLSRLIKAHFGMSLKQYVNDLRLTSAYNSIILTNRTPEDISEELGFSSFSHFNKIFKAKFAVTPAALRKQRGVWTA
jgi:AraC-like DNA-binding protein